MHSLIVVGSTLYWVADATGIMSMPITGGTVTTVVNDGNVTGNLASDGTSLYFDINAGQSGGQNIESVSLTGTGLQTLASNVSTKPMASGDVGDHFFVVNGTLYAGTGIGPLAIPTAGGSSNLIISSGSEMELLWVDSSGAYLSSSFGWNGGPGVGFYDVPLPATPGSMATPTLLATPSTSLALIYPWAGDFAVVGGAAYYVDGGQSSATLYKAPVPSGPGTMVASLPGLLNAALVADANGAFVLEGQVTTDIYRIDLSTGATTPFVPSKKALDGNPVSLTKALDAHNLYYAVTESSGTDGIYAKAR